MYVKVPPYNKDNVGWVGGLKADIVVLRAYFQVRRFLAGTFARSAGAWKVMEYSRLISDWVRLRGLGLLVIGKGLIDHHWTIG